jgi:hypothetical protein
LNRWLGLIFLCWAVCGYLFRPASAAAQVGGYSALEKSVVEQRLAERGLELETEPEGKLIEGIQIVTLDVFDERDPMPDLVNILHTTTRQRVIRQELLFDEGERFRRRTVYETARNLRHVPQLSIVLIVAARGSSPDRVRVLVITKDVWSLRLNWALQSANGHINALTLNPSEENWFGTHATVGGLFLLDPATYSLGLTLSHRRLFGTHVLGVVAANVISNRNTGASEGSFGEFRYGQPLYSLDTRWSWGTSILWRHDIARRFFGVDVATYRNTGIPETYDRDRLYGGYEVVRSFGHRFKYDLSFGVEAVRSVNRARDLSAYDPGDAVLFRTQYLPSSDQRISPFFQLHAHRTDFDSLIEVETLGLQEDFRRGHDLLLRVYPASSAIGSTRDLLGTLSELSYTFPVSGGLVRPLLGWKLEHASEGRDEALLETKLRIVSPRSAIGRLVLDGAFLDHVRNYSNTRFAIGGDTRPRGYPVGLGFGNNYVAATAELRTTSVDIFSAQVGGAAFYDVADAPDDLERLNLRHGAGVGVRVLFPEFDRIVFRADWGFPLSPGYQHFPGAFFISFTQAFEMPGVAAPSVLTESL